ncbi:MAG: restriction endonuclease subunit S [Mariniphaga sp.]
MSEVNNIPKHWQLKTLGEVADYLNGRAFKPTEWEPTGSPIIRIQNLNKADAIYNYTNREFEDKYKIDKGDLLYAWSASLGVYIWNGNTAWLNQHIFKVVPKDICHKKFLFYALEKVTAELYSKAHGSGMVHVTKGIFEETEILLPPLSEQQAIVSKIEELLSDLDNGKQQLQIAQQQLKIYRQSLLKWAFEGKLTNQNVNDGELPKGWKWVKLEDVCKKIGDIDHKMPKQLSSGYPYVSTKDFTDTLKISFDNAKYISEEDYLNLARKIRPERGDIIFPRYGTIGKNILVDFDKEFLVSYSCAVVKPNQKLVISKYVYLYTLSPKITEEIRKYTVETTQANVGIASIKSFVFPFPPLAEQQLIVDELESKLTVCDKIEETISQSLLQAESLRQSILKKAFEGKLI